MPIAAGPRLTQHVAGQSQRPVSRTGLCFMAPDVGLALRLRRFAPPLRMTGPLINTTWRARDPVRFAISRLLWPLMVPVFLSHWLHIVVQNGLGVMRRTCATGTIYPPRRPPNRPSAAIDYFPGAAKQAPRFQPCGLDARCSGLLLPSFDVNAHHEEPQHQQPFCQDAEDLNIDA
jgi:hypothetical protein